MKRKYILSRQNQNAVCQVQFANGRTKWLTPDESLKFRRHSPDGFEFGYAGSGPAQLALAILLDFCEANCLDEAWALDHYQAFKEKFIATAGNYSGTITSEQIAEFLKAREAV